MTIQSMTVLPGVAVALLSVLLSMLTLREFTLWVTVNTSDSMDSLQRSL